MYVVSDQQADEIDHRTGFHLLYQQLIRFNSSSHSEMANHLLSPDDDLAQHVIELLKLILAFCLQCQDQTRCTGRTQGCSGHTHPVRVHL